MSSNSVCNHTRDKQIGLPLRGRPIDFVITRMITDRIGLHSVLLPLLSVHFCYRESSLLQRMQMKGPMPRSYFRSMVSVLEVKSLPKQRAFISINLSQ